MTMTTAAISGAGIQHALADAERLLAAREAQDSSNIDDTNENNNHHSESSYPSSLLSPYAQLQQLDANADELWLAKDVAAWMKQWPPPEEKDFDNETSSVTRQAQRCQALGELLQSHAPPTIMTSSSGTSLYQSIYEGEFLPTVTYLQSMLTWQLRQALRRRGYPSPRACEELMDECEAMSSSSSSNNTFATTTTAKSLTQQQTAEQNDNASFSQIALTAQWLHRLQVEHGRVEAHVRGTSFNPASLSPTGDPIILELCRPIVERVRHHFVLQLQQQDQPNPKKTRIERLPEWLFSYLRQHVFPQDDDNDGPWDVIHYGLTPMIRPDFSADFLNEIMSLIQWTFAQHDLFRHPQLTENGSPLHLVHVIEQLLQFDDFIANTVLASSGSGSSHLAANRVVSLMDVYVAGDDELLEWWMEREREAAFDSLFHGAVVEVNNDDDNSNEYTPPSISPESLLLYHPVAPRAELFCSLLRSIRLKASVFSFSGPYLQHVAHPLCLRFLDAVGESASDLKQALQQRRYLPTSAMLAANVTEWIRLINGTHMSARMLLGQDHDEDGQAQDAVHAHFEEGTSMEHAIDVDNMDSHESMPEMNEGRSSAHHNMQKFGQSLERLENVFIEEFANAFVETLLLEKTKLANYLMMCSHVLASYDELEQDHQQQYDNNNTAACPDLSPDLADAQHLLETFLRVVDEPTAMPHGNHTALFASRALRDAVLTRVTEKFLEVALDWHGTTPEIYPSGAQKFATDVSLLLGDSLLPQAAMRLLDVNTCMCMPAPQLSALGDVLSGLAGQPPPLSEDMFAVDHRVYDEAVSMIRAKNLLWLSLCDFLSILNRRPDLSHIGAY